MESLENLSGSGNKKRKRLGRGGPHGTYAGRGVKGTKARNKVPAHIEGGGVPLYRRLPKIRKMKFHVKVRYIPISLTKLTKAIERANLTVTKVDQELLRELSLIKKSELGKLVDGELSPSSLQIVLKTSQSAAKRLVSCNCEVLER
jgi:large subunit ribosomal protein L15